VRLLAALLIASLLSGCAGVPAAVIWTTVGAGLGAVGSGLVLTNTIVVAELQKKSTSPPMPGLTVAGGNHP
jgi:hypothetical protein